MQWVGLRARDICDILAIMWFWVCGLPQHCFCNASRNDYSSCDAAIVEGFMAKVWHVTFARHLRLSLDIHVGPVADLWVIWRRPNLWGTASWAQGATSNDPEKILVKPQVFYSKLACILHVSLEFSEARA